MARNKTARAAAEMKGVRLMALPLLSGVRVGELKAGKQGYLFPNRIPFPDLSKRWLAENTPMFWCPPEGPARQQRFDWAINMLADPDDYSHALIWQDQMIAPEVPIFNHPRAVMQTRRDLSSRRLSGVSGLVVPLCVRFRADSLAAFEQTFADNAFRYPVLVRPCTTQNGRGQLRIDGPQDWDAALNSQWFGQPHYMVQFEDIQTAEGLYFKARVVFAGGQAFVRHVKISTDWQVHNRASGRVSDDRELEIVDRLEASPVFRTLCDEVAARTRLDLCGMDVGVDPERERYVLFECNPAMSIFFAPRPDLTPEQVDRRNRLQAPLEQAVDALLRDPAGWAAARMGVQDLPTVRGAMTT